MGQQQLLLIALGVILIGLSITVGINVAATTSVDANRDAIYSDLQNICAIARNFFSKPVEMGGGGYSFENFVIPSNIDTTENGTYEISRVSRRGDQIRIRGIGTAIGNDGSDPVRIEARIKFDEIRMVVQN